MRKTKTILATLMLVLGLSAYAQEDRMWNSLLVLAPAIGGEVDGDGAGWWVEIFNITDDVAISGTTAATLGWVTGFGYFVNDFSFGSATEGDSVLLRLYNNADPLSATLMLDSASQILADLTDPIAPGANDVTFDLSSSTWQAVPEPATFLLFGMGGFGAWLIRRKNRISK